MRTNRCPAIKVTGNSLVAVALSYLAVAAGVGVIVPLDKALPEQEIKNLIERSKVDAVIYENKYNEVFNSIREAGNFAKIDPSTISKYCRGKQKTSGGYHWEYVDN